MDLRSLYYSLPVALRYPARKLYFFFKPEKTQYYNDIRLPKSGEIFTGRGNFLEIGFKVRENLLAFCGLNSRSRVFDIGCGLGRIAIPLTSEIQQGEYHGLDIVKKGINYCRQQISAQFPNFHFHHQPLYNDLYTSGGKKATETSFPVADSSMDIAVANSLFTHLVLEETEKYIQEAARILKPGGKFYATFFVRNAQREEGMKNLEDFSFPHRYEKYSLMNKKVKSANVAFDQEFLESLFAENDLEISQRRFGQWAGPSEAAIDFQDVYVLTKVK